MESAFISWLNGLLGDKWFTILAIIIVGGGVIYTITKSVINFIKKKIKDRDKRIITKIKENESEKEFKNTMLKLVETVSSFDSEQRKHNLAVEEKLENLSTQIQKEKEESIKGDEQLSKKIDMYAKITKETNVKLDNVSANVNMMIESDKESIKAFITLQYYSAIEKGFVEPYILQSLEARYTQYLQENGNTYIGGLMDEIRNLPHQKPNNTIK